MRTAAFLSYWSSSYLQGRGTTRRHPAEASGDPPIFSFFFLIFPRIPSTRQRRRRIHYLFPPLPVGKTPKPTRAPFRGIRRSMPERFLACQHRRTEDSAAESRPHAVPWGPPEKRSGNSRHPDLNPRHRTTMRVAGFSYGQTKFMLKSTRPEHGSGPDEVGCPSPL